MSKTVSVEVCPGHLLHTGKGEHRPGESLELGEKNAADLIKRGVVRAIEDGGVIARSPDPEKMTVAQIKGLLTRMGIGFDPKATKADLLELLNTNTAEPPTQE